MDSTVIFILFLLHIMQFNSITNSYILDTLTKKHIVNTIKKNHHKVINYHHIIKESAFLHWFELSSLSFFRFVQLSGQLDDRAEHQAESLHCAWPPERNPLHLLRQGNQPGGQPQQRAGTSQNQQWVFLTACRASYQTRSLSYSLKN